MVYMEHKCTAKKNTKFPREEDRYFLTKDLIIQRNTSCPKEVYSKY